MREYFLDNDVLRSHPIPTGYQIDQDVVKRIRQRYTPDDEAKLQRMAVNAALAGDPEPQAYTDYNTYVEECRTWGDEQKTAAQALRDEWADYQPADDETPEDHRARLEDAGMI